MMSQIIMMIISAIFTGILGILSALIKKLMGDIKAIRLGTQATLRNSLLQEYNKCTEKGFATIDERDNFENMYMQYHSLGENGVMDDTRLKFFALPTTKGEDSNEVK